MKVNSILHRMAGHLCLMETISMGHSDNSDDSLRLSLIGYRDYPNNSFRLSEQSKGIIRRPSASRAYLKKKKIWQFQR